MKKILIIAAALSTALASQVFAQEVVDVGGSRWRTPQDIKDKYASASMLERNTVIFNVRGNEYRLVTVVAYQTGVVVVEWIGTHTEYTKKY